MTDVSTVRLAYCAGLIDGEAYIGAIRRMPTKANRLQSPKYSIRLSITMADEGPVRFLADTIGVGHKVYVRDRKVKANHSAMWVLDLESVRAAKLIQLVKPYLICKKEQAERALKLFELREVSAQHRNTFNNAGNSLQLDRSYLQQCDAIYLAMRRRVLANNGVPTVALS